MSPIRRTCLLFSSKSDWLIQSASIQAREKCKSPSPADSRARRDPKPLTKQHRMDPVGAGLQRKEFAKARVLVVHQVPRICFASANTLPKCVERSLTEYRSPNLKFPRYFLWYRSTDSINTKNGESHPCRSLSPIL
jgi:hypothetical protein